MVSDRQVARLWRLARTELTLELAAAKAGLDAKTARKYLRDRRLPSEMKQKHDWRTRLDPFAEVWEELSARLEVEPGLQAKTLFEHLQQLQPGRFADGQLRTLQRKIKQWRATEGPAKEVFFAQQHQPGRTVPVGLHALPRARHHDHRRGVSAPDLPLRAELLELGNGNHLLLGEFREPERGFAECAVGTGRSAARAPVGSDERGGEQSDRSSGSSPGDTKGCCSTIGWRVRRSRLDGRMKTATWNSGITGSSRQWRKR